jgi:hypothetical protein
MTPGKQSEAFNHHLDRLLHGDETDPDNLPEDDRQALGIARRLAALDLSAQSEVRYSLRRRLAQNARLRSQPGPRTGRNPALRPLVALTMALPGATLLFVLAFVLGWTFTNLGRLPASSGLASATAFAMPGTALESSLPPAENSLSVQTFAPQPLPTPIAPPQAAVYAPSTFSPDRTPSQTSPRTGSITLTGVSP